MSIDTPLLEYVIIGAHTSSWIVFLFLRVSHYRVQDLFAIDAAVLALGLPFIYLFGMIADDLAFRPLNKLRKGIQKEVIRRANSLGVQDDVALKAKDFRDEYIAFKSEVLYSAYESRVRRVRVLGTAVFNWPLLGLAVMINFPPEQRSNAVIVLVVGILLGLISLNIWQNLYKRAYEFRLKACDVICSNDAG